jgi:hypothetical protein
VNEIKGRARTRGVALLLSIVGLLAACVAASPAQGSITIGHVLGTGQAAQLSCFPTCTLRQATLAPEDGLETAGLTSPANGVVTSVGINVVAVNQTQNLTIRLRVLQGRTGVASSDPVTLFDANGIQTFETDLPISVGDSVGLDTLPSILPGRIGIGRFTAAGNSTVELFSPPLLDGGPEQNPQGSPGGVLDMNAVIEPANTFQFGSVSKNTSKGTAKIPVDAANLGTLKVAGKGVKQASKDVTGPGTVKVKVAAKGDQLKTLNKKGKVQVKAKVTFTPTGGDSRTKSKTVTLKKS